MMSEVDRHLSVLKKEKDRIEDCETYGFYPYEQSVLNALKFILPYIKELETQLEENAKDVDSNR